MLQLTQLMIDFGGVTGLWLGFAVLTFVEWFEFIVDFVVYLLYRIFVAAWPHQKKHRADC